LHAKNQGKKAILQLKVIACMIKTSWQQIKSIHTAKTHIMLVYF